MKKGIIYSELMVHCTVLDIWISIVYVVTGEGFTQGHQVGPSKVQHLVGGTVECLNTGVSGHCVARTHVAVDTRGCGHTCVARLKVVCLDTVITC